MNGIKCDTLHTQAHGEVVVDNCDGVSCRLTERKTGLVVDFENLLDGCDVGSRA